MIIYFTGTKNFYFTARYLAEKTNDSLIAFSDLMYLHLKGKKKPLVFDLSPGERLGFVYPVHAWGPPKVLLEMIDRLIFTFEKPPFCYSVATCGKNAGNSMKLINKHLAAGRLKLHSAYTLVMPNNYIIIGDIYPKKKEKEIYLNAKSELEVIASEIHEEKQGIFRVEKGFLPFVLTGLFNRGFVFKKNKASKFFSTDACNSCGECQKICPCHNIKVDNTPRWGNYCAQCLGCINQCPESAIEYGNSTEKKGRYVCKSFPTDS